VLHLPLVVGAWQHPPAPLLAGVPWDVLGQLLQPNRAVGSASLSVAGSGSQSQDENTGWHAEAMPEHLAASPAPEQGGGASLMARRVVLALLVGSPRRGGRRILLALSSCMFS